MFRESSSKNWFFNGQTMKTASILAVVLFVTAVSARSVPDETEVRKIIQAQVAAWNEGDAEAFAQHFAVDGTFTNLLGMYYQGNEAFRDRHAQLFKGAYCGSVKQEDIVSIKFVRPDVAKADSLQTITGYQKLLPGTTADSKGRLRTRLLQVMVKDGDEWKIAAYHNVDAKSGVAVPEPQ
jgi:uncharacterized protein (TIGR02246 family)